MGEEEPEIDPRDGAGRLPGRLVWALLAVAVAAGAWLRFSVFGQSLVGDELSTLWIVREHGLGGTLDFVAGDGEITPPLYFVLAWVSSRIDSAPEMVRLPSLLAGLGSLPLYYVLGKRLFGPQAARIALAVAALSPILVYFSAYGRAYGLLILLLLLSTVTMLRAADTGLTRWWIAYAAASCLAMYSHYTAAFVLLAQLLWLLWYLPEARKPALAANLGAAALYLPWVPSLIADSDSPTTPILEALQGTGFEAKRVALEQLLFWQIEAGDWSLGGRWDAALVAAGVLVALIVVGVALLRSDRPGRFRPDPGLVLAVGVALATPVGALLLGLVSTDIFGGRNLGPSWVAIPLLVGALLAACGPVWRIFCMALVGAGLLAGSVQLADNGRTGFRYEDAARLIDGRATAGDTVIDASHLTPVPLTPLDAYLDFDGPQFPLGLQSGEPPFLPGTPVPDPGQEWARAFDSGGTVFVVTLVGGQSLAGDGSLSLAGRELEIPAGWQVKEQQTFDGIYPLTVTVVERVPEGSGDDDPESDQ